MQPILRVQGVEKQSPINYSQFDSSYGCVYVWGTTINSGNAGRDPRSTAQTKFPSGY